jgi:hypothetical protein
MTFLQSNWILAFVFAVVQRSSLGCALNYRVGPSHRSARGRVAVRSAGAARAFCRDWGASSTAGTEANREGAVKASLKQSRRPRALSRLAVSDPKPPALTVRFRDRILNHIPDAIDHDAFSDRAL